MGKIKEERMAYAEEVARLIVDKYRKKGIHNIWDFIDEGHHNLLTKDTSNLLCETPLVKFYSKYIPIVFHLIKLGLHRMGEK